MISSLAIDTNHKSDRLTDGWSSHSNDSLLTLAPIHAPSTTKEKEAAAAPSTKSIPSIRSHPPHENCPDTLNCLPDTDGRPQHTLPVILRCTILGSVAKRLTIREIYAAMENKYPYYRTAGPTWKASSPVSPSVRSHANHNVELFTSAIREASSVSKQTL